MTFELPAEYYSYKSRFQLDKQTLFLYIFLNSLYIKYNGSPERSVTVFY